MMGTIPNHYIQRLSDEDCWRLFAKHAFQKVVNPGAQQDFEEISREVVKKCNGLPLGVKSLGGLLFSKKHVEEWKDILNNDIWELPAEKCDILPVIWLSYYYLPPHLKQCFAYCSVFPKGYKFQKEKLILLWMAENLLRSQQNKTLEEVGEEYFNDLTSRSFFQRHKDDFTMHDLVNDLANFVSGEFCYRMDDNHSKVITNKIGHFSCMTRRTFDMKVLEDLSKNKVLRTLLIDGPQKVSESFRIHPKNLQTMDSIGSLKYLRYLDISWTGIEELPATICTIYNLQTLLMLCFCRKLSELSDSIGNLKCLRYLDLSFTDIKEIPDAVCDLQNLHTLKMFCCIKLTHLPTNMSRFENLRHLDISDTSLTEIPLQMSNLKHLEGLTDFFVGKKGGTNIKELGNLHFLRGLLRVRNLENVVNVEHVSAANLKDKKNITDLELEWCGETEDSAKVREVLERLQPHTNVQELSISNYQATSFPGWVGHHSYCHIVSLKLVDCKNCYLLPTLGQLPSLKDLNISGFDMVEKIGAEFYYSGSSSISKPFKSLQVLSFSYMSQWKEWPLIRAEGEGGAFSQLKRLSLEQCPMMNGDCLPDIPSSTTLSITECPQLVASLRSHQLPWLGSLELQYYSNAMSFPEGRLPSSIHTMKIRHSPFLESLAKEGWPSNLKSLEINYCHWLFMHMDSFPEEGQLPTTLTYLKLLYLPKLKSLNGKGLRHLVCLEQLVIKECINLQSLPEEGLPDSLSQLVIKQCNLLSKRCQRDTGEDWPKISHIPRVRIIDS